MRCPSVIPGLFFQSHGFLQPGDSTKCSGPCTCLLEPRAHHSPPASAVPILGASCQDSILLGTASSLSHPHPQNSGASQVGHKVLPIPNPAGPSRISVAEGCDKLHPCTPDCRCLGFSAAKGRDPLEMLKCHLGFAVLAPTAQGAHPCRAKRLPGVTQRRETPDGSSRQYRASRSALEMRSSPAFHATR